MKTQKPILFEILVKKLVTLETKTRRFYVSSLEDIFESMASDEWVRRYTTTELINTYTRPLYNQICQVLQDSYYQQSHPRYAWKRREEDAIRAGTYNTKPLSVLNLIPIENHFAHVPRDDDDFEIDSIRFTPTEEYGWINKKTTMKIGRYLKKYYALTDTAIQQLTNKFIAAQKPERQTFHLASSLEDINEVFETKMSAEGSEGQTSCMWNKFVYWNVRPYHIYANNSSVAVAYSRSETTGQILARAVVNLEKRTWVRIYAVWPKDDGINNPQRAHQATCTTFRQLLEHNNFPKQGSLRGIRLNKIRDERGTDLAPYIDTDHCYLKDYGDQWIVTGEGTEWAAHSTKGYVYNLTKDYDPICQTCIKSHPYHLLVRTYDEVRIYCPTCASKRSIVEAIYIRYGTPETIYCHHANTILACDNKRYWYDTNSNYVFFSEKTNSYHVTGCECEQLRLPIAQAQAQAATQQPTITWAAPNTATTYTVTYDEGEEETEADAAFEIV